MGNLIRVRVMVVLIMGVAGSGKTTVGRQLAASVGWSFRDADDFHSPANVAKMAAGLPLDDADRAPWLAAIRTHIEAAIARGEHTVVTCSALKSRYRAAVGADLAGVKLVHLHGTPALILERLRARPGHFMKPAMLESQLAALEAPSPGEALLLDVAEPVDVLVAQLRRAFSI